MPAAAGLHTLVTVAAAFIWVGGRARARTAILAEAGTVLIAVRDSVLADSLRFSLELEGYEAKLCEPPVERLADVELRTCLLLDQEVFTTLWGKGGIGVLTRFGLPTVLMVNQRTKRLMDHANAAGVTTVLEKPLLGGVLFEAIRSALDGDAR
jgi:FixJ family two-component response regulator